MTGIVVDNSIGNRGWCACKDNGRGFDHWRWHGRWWNDAVRNGILWSRCYSVKIKSVGKIVMREISLLISRRSLKVVVTIATEIQFSREATNKKRMCSKVII